MSIYDTLNQPQQEAVFYTEGPLLILAGAGSGKTRVLTHRIAYLIDECEINPWNILAITFTNKAAKEMRDRVERLVAYGADSIWVSTFHSACVRILRRHIDLLGYDRNFTIYDTDDQKSIIKQAIQKLNLDSKYYKETAVLKNISSAKNAMISPESMKKIAGSDWRKRKEAELYEIYEDCLKKNNALDFDDLLLRTVQLFEENPETLEYYQERFQYIMVDEYQDTNAVQFQLIWLLSQKHRNICVVGDDDQSIYRFRGADITNILSFEERFAGAKVIKLEQNYRSTMNILNCANAVISHNKGRKEKKLWSENGDGTPIVYRQFANGFEEAEGIIRTIQRDVESGKRSYNDFAVLYRTNAQSRVFEEKLVNLNIPYRLIGGINFYQRAEIKDILAYLKTIANGKDDLAVRRIINVPKRGIGPTTVERIQQYADEHNLSFYDALEYASSVPNLGRVVPKLENFVQQIRVFRSEMEYFGVDELIEDILEKTSYREMLEEMDDETALSKKDNVNELISKAVEFEESNPESTLGDFLAEVALVADIDNMDESEERVTLMTMHGSKGLEFTKVFLCGMEEGLFPSSMALYDEHPEVAIEEERRLCYVGMTRAKEELMLSMAKMRMVRGENHYCAPSRFLREVPAELIQEKRPVTLAEKYRMEAVKAQQSGSASGNGKESGASQANWKQSNIFDLPKKNQFENGFSKIPIAAGKEFTVNKANGLEYGIGDTVRHIKFGTGTVMEITEGKKDYEVTVDFERVGEKRMFASFAKLKKV
ncbi:MAG: ATP-dependent helicase [Lachnospiraceae bacterium]